MPLLTIFQLYEIQLFHPVVSLCNVTYNTEVVTIECITERLTLRHLIGSNKS